MRNYYRNVVAPPSNNELLTLKARDIGKLEWEKYRSNNHPYNEFIFGRNGFVYAHEGGNVHKLIPDRVCRIRIEPRTCRAINNVRMERMSHWDRERNQDFIWNGHAINDKATKTIPTRHSHHIRPHILHEFRKDNTVSVLSAAANTKLRNAKSEVLEEYDFENDPKPYLSPKLTSERHKGHKRRDKLNIDTHIFNDNIVDDAEEASSSLSQSPIVEMPTDPFVLNQKYRKHNHRHDGKDIHSIKRLISELDGYIIDDVGVEREQSRKELGVPVVQKNPSALHPTDEYIDSQTEVFPNSQRERQISETYKKNKLFESNDEELPQNNEKHYLKEDYPKLKIPSYLNLGEIGKKNAQSQVKDKDSDDYQSENKELPNDDSVYLELQKKNEEIDMLKQELARMKTGTQPQLIKSESQHKIDTSSSSNSLANGGEDSNQDQEPEEQVLHEEEKVKEARVNHLDTKALSQIHLPLQKRNRFMCLPIFTKKKGKQKDNGNVVTAPGAIDPVAQ